MTDWNGILAAAREMADRPLPAGIAAACIALLMLAGAVSVTWGLGLLAVLAAWVGLRGEGSGLRPPPSAPLPAQSSEDLGPPFSSQIFESIPDPALLLDRQARVIATNGAASALYSTRPGQHIALVDRSPELLAAVEAALRTGAKQTFDLRALSPVERHLTGLAIPLTATDDAPETPALLVVLSDRTEAEQLAQMRADFVANASHELRTPLASLKGFVETLQGAAKDDPAARDQFLAIMQQQAERMSRLIDDLLSLSRIEMREHVAPTTTLDLVAIARETTASLGPLANAAGISLTLTTSDPVLPVIGDRDELLQVAQNLIQNAIKYGRRGGKVEVRLGTERDRTLLTISDDGIGIAPEHLPRLTERFYRVSAKDSRERGGTGLGLAIVKHIVNRHRGALRIASTVGEGSTFTVEVPSASRPHTPP